MSCMICLLQAESRAASEHSEIESIWAAQKREADRLKEASKTLDERTQKLTRNLAARETALQER